MRAHGLAFEVAQLSDPGRDPTKQTNEDSAAYADTPAGYALVLCDGMGGHENGKLASETAVRTILSTLSSGTAASPASALRGAIEAAAREVYAVGADAPMGLRPGSTCVAVLLHAAGAEIAHVGDSRIYLWRSGSLERLTRDHSMVQQMVDIGVLSEEDAQRHPDANRITRALGMRPDVEVELRPTPVQLTAGDLILLCSDGLSDMLEDSEIEALCATNLPGGPAVIAQRLVELANEHGGHDNVTVQIAAIQEAPPQPRIEPTLVDVPLGAAAERPEARAPTLPDTSPGAPGGVLPTLVDGAPARNTEPVVAYRFADSGAPGTGPERVRRKTGLLIALLLVLMALGVAAVVWTRAHRSAEDETIPPPSAEPHSPAPHPHASAVVLSPEIPSATPEESSSADRPAPPVPP